MKKILCLLFTLCICLFFKIDGVFAATRLCLDFPKSDIDISSNITIQGWIMSTEEVSDILAYVDGEKIDFKYERTQRNDVLQVITGYGDSENNKLPGFNGYVDFSTFTDGVHTFKIEVLGNNNELLSNMERNIKLSKYKTTLRLDSPLGGITSRGTTLNYSGWYLSTAEKNHIQVLINGNDETPGIERVFREDAIRVYGSEYGINSDYLAGYKGSIDVSKYKDGNLNIKINIIDDNTGELLSNVERNIKLNKYKTTLRLDSPSGGITSKGPTLNYSGWYLSTAEKNHIQVLINGNDETPGIERVFREDAIRVYGSEYGINSDYLAGYKGSIDVSKYKDGNLNIKINIIDDNTGELLSNVERNIRLKKYDGIITIDYPNRNNFNKSSTLKVQGWQLSTANQSLVKIYIDDREYEVLEYARADVINAYPNSYGGPSVNLTPGFSSTISLNSYSEGIHRLKIILLGNTNEVIEEKIISFYVYEHTYFGIDVSSHQGRINWAEVKSSGIDFAIIRLGYGSNFSSQDDSQFWNNVRGAAEQGIPYGVYLYSYATLLHGPSGLNVDSPNSDSEAAHSLRLLNSLSSFERSQFKLPVFVDMEESKTIYLGKPFLTAIADNFCSTMVVNGY